MEPEHHPFEKEIHPQNLHFLGFHVSFRGVYNLPETNIAPKNGWLEYDPFLLGFGLFSGANC